MQQKHFIIIISNVAGTSSLKLLTVVDNVRQTLHEFRKMATSTAFIQTKSFDHI